MSNQSFTELDEEIETCQKPNEQIVCSFYINSCFPVPDVYDGISHETAKKVSLPFSKLNEVIDRLSLQGSHWLFQTNCGIIASFSKHEDAEILFNAINLAEILETPVQVAMLPMVAPIIQVIIIENTYQIVT